MRAFLLICVVVTSITSAQAQSAQPCPTVAVDAVEKVEPGTPIVFTARPANLKYIWQISAGTIVSGQNVSGQNTSSITVDTVGLGGQSITATVQVAGAESVCPLVSKKVDVAPQPIVCDRPFDEYGDIKFEDEQARLDNFAIQLENIPSARGAITAFAGEKTYRGEAVDRLRRAKDYLVKVRHISHERLMTIDAGYRHDLTILLHVVPEGATMPTLDSMIPLSTVSFTKRRPGKKNR